MFLPTILLAALVPTIWIVDAANGPGTNFTDLPAAVAAAANGDVIVVRSGNYTSFGVAGKSLTIRGAGAATTLVSIVPAPPSAQQTVIDAVPAGQPFHVSGITFFPGPPTAPASPFAGLRIFGSQTQVVLADVVVTGMSNLGGGIQGAVGLYMNGGVTVHAERCTFTGGASTGLSGGYGTIVGNVCRFAADACTFNGGSAGSDQFAQGGTGIVVTAYGAATLSRCSAFGGGALIHGGAGLGVSSGSWARVAGDATSVFQGGLTGGAPGYWGTAMNAPGVGAITVHGPVTLLPAGPGGPITSGPIVLGALPLPYLSTTGALTPAGELLAAQPVAITFEGVLPFAPFSCILDFTPSFSFAFASIALGELLLPVPTSTFDATLDASGSFQVFLTPSLSVPSLTDIPLFLQFGVFDSLTGQFRLSNFHTRVFRN